MKKYVICIIALLCEGVAIANPNITNVSGIIQHGNYISISGNNFGVKSPARPTIWCDFEDGKTGCNSSLSSGTPYTYGTHWNWTDGNPHANSTRNLYTTPYTNGEKTASGFGIDAQSTKFFGFNRRKVPVDWWSYMANYKTFYANSSDTSRDDEIGYTWQYHNFNGSSLDRKIPGQMNFRADPGEPNIDYGFSLGNKMPNDGSWFIEEYQMKRSSAINVQDGKVYYWVNGVRYTIEDILDWTADYPAQTYGTMILDEYWQTWVDANNNVFGFPINNGKVQYDDIYMDTTWARVMIGNSSMYDACTHREPLIPTTWSSGSITAYFNQGSFRNQESVYLFVVDSNGLTSNGFSIKIGGEYNSTINIPINIPKSPFNLRIQ